MSNYARFERGLGGRIFTPALGQVLPHVKCMSYTEVHSMATNPLEIVAALNLIDGVLFVAHLSCSLPRHGALNIMLIVKTEVLLMLFRREAPPPTSLIGWC